MPKQDYQTPETSKLTIIDSEKNTSYRGFSSIDQEMEREIAMQWFIQHKGNDFFSPKFFVY